ncbi:MAG: YIP1 family protein [Halobacteriaceae archaeon]
MAAVTTWVEDPGGGRDRGIRAIARAWIEVLTRPERFFRTGVAPGDQAPGLVFGLAVVAVAATTHLATKPTYATRLGQDPTLSLIAVFLLYVVVLAPVVLHLGAALETAVLIGVVPSDRRAGVSETVQVLAYAGAPCALAGVPVPPLRLVCVAYAFFLAVLGTVIVHRTSWGRATVATLLPGGLLYGYGFGGFAAAVTVFEALG